MQVAGHLSGGAGVLKKYQVNEAIARAGVPLLVTPAGGAGLALGAVAVETDMVGISEDTATYVTAQQTGNATVERLITVDIRPDAIFKARLSGTAASGGALVLNAVTTASADGLDITTGAEWSSPTFDEGTVWGYDGANAGQVRRITSVSSTAGTVTVAFNHDTVVGDNFLRIPFAEMGLPVPTLTTELNEINCIAAAVLQVAGFRCIELIALPLSGDGRNKSYALIVAKDHVLKGID